MRIDLPEPQLFRELLMRETGQSVEVVPEGITLDSREARRGDLYVALKGEQVDGHDYIEAASEKGCVAALVTRPTSHAPLPQLQVNDPALTIANLAQEWRSNFSVPVIGITGSNGKTSTKDLLVHIFSESHHVHSTRGNYNTRLGLPLTLLELTSHHTLSILEMGANQRGDIGYLCSLSQPRYGLITNIAPAHLQGFGSMENVTKTKGELFDALPSDGIAFVNSDDKRIVNLPTKAKKITYGFNPDCDVSADLRRGQDGMLTINVNGREMGLNSYNNVFALNVLAACAISVTLGVSWESFREVILTAGPTAGRCSIKKYNGVTVIDDTYNANLTSTLSALELLSSIPAEGRRLVVFGDMLELGEASRDHHRRVGKECANSGVDLLLCYGDESETTAEMAESSIEARHFGDKGDLAVSLRDELRDGDVVLFKGSRGMALETVIEEVFEG